MLDVREPHEYQIVNIKGHLIPLGDLPTRVHELDSSREIVVHCKSGARSAKAVDFLRKSGFKRAANLTGGILALSLIHIYAAGGTIFGLGWALTGACPGPLFALIGNGVSVMVVAVVSALAGTWIYGWLRPRLPH